MNNSVLHRAKTLLESLREPQVATAATTTLVLSPHQAERLAVGTEPRLVTKGQLPGGLYLIDDGTVCYGTVRVERGVGLSIAELRSHPELGIDDATRRSRWPSARKLYASEVQWVVKHEQPVATTLDDETELAQQAVEAESAQVKLDVKILKRGSDEERYVFGVVLVPNEVDSQGDIYDEEAVKYASRYFMAARHRMGFMHEFVLEDAKYIVVDNYLAPMNMELEGEPVKKGTWLLGVIVPDDELWARVKSGELNGFSIEGVATVEPV